MSAEGSTTVEVNLKTILTCVNCRNFCWISTKILRLNMRELPLWLFAHTSFSTIDHHFRAHLTVICITNFYYAKVSYLVKVCSSYNTEFSQNKYVGLAEKRQRRRGRER